MKKDLISVPLLPFTEEEEAALIDKLTAMDSVALGHYIASAKLSLGNKALDKSWQPRIEFGLSRAEAVLLHQAQNPPPAAEAVDAESAPKAKSKAKAAKAPEEDAVES